MCPSYFKVDIFSVGSQGGYSAVLKIHVFLQREPPILEAAVSSTWIHSDNWVSFEMNTLGHEGFSR